MSKSMKRFPLWIAAILLAACLGIPLQPAFAQPASLPTFPPNPTLADKVRLEADYILACQVTASGDPAYGAINNVFGEPTWVVPRENGMAILGLILASDILGDDLYRTQAQLAAEYLVGVQPIEGAWYDQYNHTTPVDLNRSPTQTAEVMIALHRLGYQSGRYQAMKKGAEFLMRCQDVNNKGGNDDGLLGGGQDALGNYQHWRWTHDNAYAYWALKAAETWAIQHGDPAFADQCHQAADAVLNGINTYLYNPVTGVWYIAIDENGVPQWISHLDSLPSWIQYAPQMLDLPAQGVNAPAVGEWIHIQFQQADGSCIGYLWDSAQIKTRKYPGLCFQAALAWFDTGHTAYAESAIQWAENSGLWRTITDTHGITGGWVDWIEVSPDAGQQAEFWKRFIDTSFYAIASWNGGYHFAVTTDKIYLPAILLAPSETRSVRPPQR